MWKDVQWNHLVTLPPEKSSWTAWTPLNQLSGGGRAEGEQGGGRGWKGGEGRGRKNKVFWSVHFPQIFILIH